MNNKSLAYIFIFAALIIPSICRAQFYVTGDDPGKARWYSIETDNFKVIYPEGADSLAREYATEIERYRIPVSLTTGYASGYGDGRKMPVVMHAYNAANGSVAWAPKRMDLFTIPSAYDPEPLPWTTMLSVHESRHVTQMQFGMTKAQRPFGWALGEMWNILASLVYPGISNMEGDAVIAETAWTPSGRGRTADFLNYYWVAFDNGDFRNWNKWRFVSQKHNAPNYYSLGYLTLGGFRYLYDCPEIMSEVYHLAARRPYNIFAFNTTVKKMTGRRFKDAFMEVCDTMYTLWNASAEVRRPYIPSEPVSAPTRMYTDYIDNLVVGSDIYAVKKGHVDVPALVRIDSTGKEHRISLFPHVAGRPKWSPEHRRIYWSETRTDPRWNLQTESVIGYISPDDKGKGYMKNGSLMHNPAPSPSGVVASVRYDIGGRSYIDISDGAAVSSSFHAPDSLQLVETAWIEEILYATAISENGYGIYCLDPADNGSWKCILSPQPVMIKDFGAWQDELMFTCDRTGVNELYHLDPSDCRLVQKTSTRYGASDFSYSEDGEWLYYSSQTLNGMRIFRTHSDSLMNKAADFTQLHHYPIAEAVTAQEKAIAESRGVTAGKEVHISEPKRYRKLTHMFNVHSWAPVYVNVDNIMNMSFGNIWEAASLGVTGIMQNRLSTATGEFGYSAHKDPYNPVKWRHSGHARFRYSGLYPVFEVSVDVNDRAARQYNIYAYHYSDDRTGMEISSEGTAVPYVEGRISTYVPFRFSRGGWFKGVTPRLTYMIGNDMFDTTVTDLGMEDHIILGENGELTDYQQPVFIGHKAGKNTSRHSISGSLNAYVIQSTANSAVYPRWGFGMEAGASGNIDSRNFISPMGYLYAYGYIPGIMREHGLRLSAMSQMKLNRNAVFGQAVLNILPRGFSYNASITSRLSVRNSFMTKLTADYAIPVFIGDLSIGGSFFSIKRLLLTPHFDATFYSGNNLWSAGSDVELDMHSILTLEWPCTFGVTFSYNGGSAFESLIATSGMEAQRWYFGPTFNVTF
ncbi:MAG: hypothetical protein IJ971_11170 [Bacteroidales bacterium]|nr:hypothetical protein [Bacteroidales bacterium]